MKSDLITIFNQLTCNELADYNIFSDLIENHYEKFKYLYSLIDELDLSKINKIYCKTSKKLLTVTICVGNIIYLNEVIFDINANRNNYLFSEYFILNLIEERDELRIVISAKNDMKESDMYAHRFV